MRIVILNPYFYPYFGGTEKVLYEVYRRLSSKYEIYALVSAHDGRERLEEIDGIKVYRLKSKTISLPGAPMGYQFMPDLINKIKELRGDLYHLNNRYQYTLSHVKAIKKTGRFMMTIHNALPKGIDLKTDTAGLIYDLLFGVRMMRSADHLTAVSEYTLRSTIPMDLWYKSEVIQNGVETSRFKKLDEDKAIEIIKEELNIDIDPSKKLYIMSNGRLVEQKGHKYLIEAMHILKKDGGNDRLDLIIVGRGKLKDKYERLIAKLGLKDSVSIISRQISEDALNAIYSISKVYVMPSLYEPSGMALMEALAVGIPSIASKVGGMPEIMKDDGLYVKPRSSTEIADAIRKLISSYDVYLEKAKNASKRICRYNNWDRIADMYDNAIKKALDI
ncbi:MAG: D-inositol-3-phosphate glycosyltransferase [Candidatus Micrarchaeota archaeon]|nr:MAG: D-inositol-3-phosphate glycosyltransferase [Candidatus Micrarchaeota archaeon]